MPDPRITTIIPTYRRPHSLRRSVESVLAQTYPDLVVSIFDNASGDETAAVVKDLARKDPRVRYHCHEKNLGAAANFQAGLAAVQTPYFSFLSDDDFLLPGFYAHAMNVLEEHPEAGFFCGQTVMYDPLDGSHILQPQGDWAETQYPAGESTVRMIRSMFIWTGSLFRTEVGRAAGPLVPGTVVDVLFLARAAALFPFYVAMKPCAVFSADRDRTVHAMSPDELKAAYDLVSRELARMPEVSDAQRKEIADLLEHFRGRILKYRLKRTFLAGDWEAFDRAVAFLRGRGELTHGMRIRSIVSGLRKSFPSLVDATRRFYGRIEGHQRSRRSAGERAAPEDLLALYGPVLPGAIKSGTGEAGAIHLESKDTGDAADDRVREVGSDKG